MEKHIGILHVSDIHMCEKDCVKISRLVEKLKEDVLNLKEAHNVDITCICISGDLINSGDNSEQELQLWLDYFLQPIMDFLGINETNVFIVPGNHEIKKSMISPYIEKGLSESLTTAETIDSFLNSPDYACLAPVSYFHKDFSGIFGPKAQISNPLYQSYIVEHNDIKIGIACINSAWRSTGSGAGEKNKMIIGKKQIIDTCESIKTADLKICLVHHPFDWLVDADKTSIEKCINAFDIVLTGHIHESETKLYVNSNGQTLFNTCGKFDNTSDIYNGYSLLSINPYNKECTVYLRQYFGYPRDSYDKALCVCSDGTFTTSLSKKDDNLTTTYDMVLSIRDSFAEFSNDFFIAHSSDENTNKGFDSSFITPDLSDSSEYEKETQFNNKKSKTTNSINLKDICKSNDNILFYGKQNIGKTTILHYITKHYLSNFNAYKKVPIVLNIHNIDFSGKMVLERAILKFIDEYCDESHSFTKRQISELIKSGLFVIMFDNLDVANEKQIGIINQFITDYPNNRFIFTKTEHISSKPLGEQDCVLEYNCNIVHICSLSKNQIRSIAKKNFADEGSSNLVDKIMLCFKNTSLPKTPFIVSMILSLCKTKEFSPINEAVLMEQFLEQLLEKSSDLEVYSSSFDFRDKEDFLIYLVGYMHDKNKFYLSFHEFDELLYKYHSNLGYSVSETHFDSLFFEKGVLVKIYDTICFKYNCFVEYYLAKKATISDDFLRQIIENRNYLNYAKELLYYTGLNRKRDDIANVIENDLQNDFKRFLHLLNEIHDYKIGINIALPDDDFDNNITHTKLSQTESDTLQDYEADEEHNNPRNIDKTVSHEEMDTFVKTLIIYGNCLKTLDHLSFEAKQKMYSNYLSGLCLVLGIFTKRTEEYYEQEITDMQQSPEEFSEKEIQEVKEIAKDIIKIALPIILQNIALENIGTVKLKKVIEYVIINNSNDFQKFFSVFLYCDLRIPGLRDIIKNYCYETKNKSLLTIIFFKLMYYYRFGYFSSSLDQFLENTLKDINSKLYSCSKVESNLLISKVKNQKRLERGKF